MKRLAVLFASVSCAVALSNRPCPAGPAEEGVRAIWAVNNGERVQNVWANPITFDNRGQPRRPIADQGFANGDGVLLYPGEDKVHPEEDRGVPGPCSTLQMANFRRGLQDHRYLTIARRLGLNELVDEALSAVVPRVFSDAKGAVGFAETGNEYEAVHLKLARAIAASRPRP